MSEDLCIAIAVSRPEGLDPLPGAIPSAKRLAAWAQGQGYATELVTDASEAVTCARLTEVLHRCLDQGGQRRIIIAFAGHGLMRGGAEEFWLLNQWRNRAAEAVNHLKLRDRLGTYRPKQLAIISDACRSLATQDARWVEGTGVVDTTNYVEQPVQVANLSGTRATQPAYTTPLEAGDAYCFFTQVLTRALNGKPPDALTIDDQGRRVVLSDDLFNVIERELPLLASQHGRSQTPDLSGAWRAPGNIWSILQTGASDAPLLLPSAVTANYERAVEAAAPTDRRATDLEHRLTTEPRPLRYETGTGVTVQGACPVAVVASPAFRPEAWGPPGSFRFWPDEGAQRGSMAIELAGGSWVAGPIYTGFIGAFTLDGEFAEGLVLRPSDQDPRVAEATVAAAASGQVLSDPYDLAARLRDQKHADPVLGALAAYAYARAGAVEDIRRLCDFYRQRRQPVPFDAILLARVPIRREADGLRAILPPVAAREPLTDMERARRWTYEATAGGEVAVAGGFPWLRQGWALLEDDFRPELRAVARFAPGILPGLFTTLRPRQGEQLARAIAQGEI